MMKIVLVEDEFPARKKIKKYLEKISEPYTIVKELEAIEEVLSYFQSEPEIDLIFSDIELLDGNVFNAYKNLNIKAPIIFSTAYNQFWMNAFETTGIAYLLKPYSFERFEAAIQKYLTLKSTLVVESSEQHVLEKLESYFSKQKEEAITYQDFIPVKTPSYTYFLKIEEIMYFQADYGVIVAYDNLEKKHILNQTSLKSVEDLIDPTIFFKINRSEFINKNFIEKISRYTKNSVAIHLRNSKTTLKTSQNSTAAFNNWLGL
ncbi:LytR/AlgR family response regulator transcription factor [Tenacibaculum aiptasiae]|uniref:LytR/AlgR family response regulator transcription factor n=1 Tax=Tenacibaculum aiptasiae TaxID=426481 RepID=UPI00232C34AB|nr:LytTR family DNA-binding domain-containing protein [Tenacibaculum aiptasiae]